MANLVDTYVAYKFIKMLVTPWKDTEAFRLGIIDENGNNLRKRVELKTPEERKSYTQLHILVYNIKKLIEKLPGGKSKAASYASALWMLKEHLGEDGDKIEEVFIDYMNIDVSDESININEDTTELPIGRILGIDIYKKEDSTDE